MITKESADELPFNMFLLGTIANMLQLRLLGRDYSKLIYDRLMIVELLATSNADLPT